jgi:anaerobic selenocysteine-containing dehydrogenase
MMRREVYGACPLDCPDTCSWLVTVEDGRAVGLRGDPEHPYTRGVLCNKLRDFVEYSHSPERAPRPGTDAALALGLLNVVLAEGAEDSEFIEQHTLGWEAFRARILEFEPARVAEICGLSVDQVVDLGQRLARTRPTGIRLAMGMQRHGGGGMAVRTITCIPGVTGDWRYPGGGAVFHDNRVQVERLEPRCE